MLADLTLTCATGSMGPWVTHSYCCTPALGPASWAPVASALAQAGHQVVVPALAGFTAGGPSGR
jgi:hypothetical protein